MKTVLRISCLMLSLLMVASAWGMMSSARESGYEIILLNSYKEPITVKVVEKGAVWDAEYQSLIVPAKGAVAIAEGAHRNKKHLKWWKESAKGAVRGHKLGAKYMPMPYDKKVHRYMIIEVQSELDEKGLAKEDSRAYTVYLDRSDTKPQGWDQLFQLTSSISKDTAAKFDFDVRWVLQENFKNAQQGKDDESRLSQLPASSLTYHFGVDEKKEAFSAPVVVLAPRSITNENFEKIAGSFIRRMKEQLRNGTWVSKKTLLNTMGEVQDKDAVTFVQKKQIPNDAHIKFATDIHGNGQTFFKWLENLQNEGFLDKSNPFKIIQKNGYIALLGDYVDRGQQGLDVLMGAMLLYLNNPDHVIMLRGNHEYKRIYRDKGFFDEVNKNETIAAIADVIFDLLPSACYFLWENEQHQKQCILSVHGGPHFGYKPQDLLASAAENCYEVVEYKTIASSAIESVLCKEFASWGINPFAWVDFAQEARFSGGRLRLTKENMLQYFKESMPKDIRLLAVVRGHQNAPWKSADFKVLEDNGVDIFNSGLQFENPDTAISLALIQGEPFLITIGSLIELNSPDSANVDWHKTTLDLILQPELKKSNFVRRAIDTNRKFVDYKINLQERIREGMKKLFQE